MDCLATSPVLSNKLIPFSTTNSKLGAGFHRIYRRTTKQKLCLSFSRENCECRSNVAIKSSRGVSSFQTQQEQEHGTWEEPDIRSDSDDEYGDEEDKSLGFKNDGEQKETETQDEYEERIKKEVEQLLKPEELEILQQNVTPNLEKISSEKWSPLHSLGLSFQIYSMDKLLESGHDIDFVNKEGLTALHKAVIGKKEAVISHLLRKGASPHVQDKDGATPLHYAVQVGAKQTVKLLIKYNVDVNVADNDGKTALDISICYGKDFMSYDLARLIKIGPGN